MEPSSALLAALALVLDRPELASDPRLLCSAALVCSSWRAAVAASGAGTTDVVLWLSSPSHHSRGRPEDTRQDMLTISSFAAWLSQHGSLVRGITLHGLFNNHRETVTTACQVLGMALRFAAVCAAAAGRPMRLQVFKCDAASSDYSSRPLLATLPDSLTELHVKADECFCTDAAGVAGLSDVLTRLRHLRKLCICQGWKCRQTLPPQALTALSGLTCLELNWVQTDKEKMAPFAHDNLCSMPLLQQLSLDMAGADNDNLFPVCELDTVTALTKLQLSMSDRGFEDAALPPQLQDLTLCLGTLHAEQNLFEDLKLKQLGRLRSLHLRLRDRPLVALDGYAAVRRLTQLSSLELSYTSIEQAIDDSGCWGNLPKIRGLSITNNLMDEWDAFQGLEQTYLPQVEKLLHLTRLELTLVTQGTRQDPAKISCFLSSLVGLQHLHLLFAMGEIEVQDCLNLCQLSRLTSLRLPGTHQGVGDTVAVALASSMPLLKHLGMPNCDISSVTVIPALARLRHLTQLVLSHNPFGGVLVSCKALMQQLRDPNWPKLVVEW